MARMPVEFLSDAEAAAYGRYDGGPSREELDRVFFLDNADRELVEKRRGEHNRLGFALQLTTARWLGVFLPDPTDVPETVLSYVARQLDIADPSCVERYLERRPTRFDHAEEIKRACAYREFAQARSEFEEWLWARAWMTGDGLRAIFADAVGWLRERDVLLPGATTLARLVARARADGDERLWETLASAPTVEQTRVLEGLLEVSEESRFSDLERWRKGPADPTGKSLRLALRRVAEIHEFGIDGSRVRAMSIRTTWARRPTRPPTRSWLTARPGSRSRGRGVAGWSRGSTGCGSSSRSRRSTRARTASTSGPSAALPG